MAENTPQTTSGSCCCSCKPEDDSAVGIVVAGSAQHRLTTADHLGAWKVRWRIGRADYRIRPGLYRLGSPGPVSPVLVSANYKLSFDILRSSLVGIDAWLLVLDTRGINVWCAAGKGTFGTDELVRQVRACGLEHAVEHRNLVVPQLSAPGVAAHEVLKATGFRVRFGPVRAADLPEYLSSGMKATEAMRRVTFPFVERLKVAPVDFLGAMKWALVVAVALFILSGLGRDGFAFARLVSIGLPAIGLVVATIFLASFLAPLLLPWLPGRPFALKGLWLGLALAAGAWATLNAMPATAGQTIGNAGWLLLVVAATSFVTMNYTGTSTYTSLSGVLKEMKMAVPAQAATAVAGLALWLAGRFF